MKRIAYLLALLPLVLTGCARSRGTVWEDTKTAGRYAARGFHSMTGNGGDSRQIHSRGEFICGNEYDDEYFPLYDAPSAEHPVVQEREIAARPSPGDLDSKIPGIDAFYSPSARGDTAHVFSTVHFPYNSSTLKGKENLLTVRKISEYLVGNPNVYVFVEGHCDERGPEAYNLSLGIRRSNAVRSLLIKEGVNPDQLFTISYGKEHPLVMEHNEDAWQENRRGAFKIYHQHHNA